MTPEVRSEVRAQQFRGRLRGDVVILTRKHFGQDTHVPGQYVDDMVGLLDGIIEALCLEIEVARKLAGIDDE